MKMRPLMWPAAFGLTLLSPALIPSAQAQSTDASPLLVLLVPQDSSDCTNSTVVDDGGGAPGGSVVLSRAEDGKTYGKVAITATPGTTYHFFLKCRRELTQLSTGPEGTASAEFSFATDEAGPVYAFDMYPAGAPAGNKFQSLTVSFR